jgi:small subunit ribosomal protein S6
MSEYELMYIVPTSFTEEELGTVEAHVAELFTKYGATLERTNRLGKLRLAYPIRHERFGHYVLARFKAEHSAVAGVEEGLRLNQKEILRHMIVRAEDVGDAKFTMVQFQEVQVDGGERRRRPGQKEKTEEKTRDEKEMKEGVAALEGGKAVELETKIETLSAEDLEKKIDSALYSDTEEGTVPAVGAAKEAKAAVDSEAAPAKEVKAGVDTAEKAE